MEPISRSLLMSVGIFKNTLSDEEAVALKLSQDKAKQEREALVLDEKVGFELGWDYARYLGWLPDEEKHKHFVGGFTSSRAHNWPLVSVDRFTRKWLQLRYGAWRRNRVFDEMVTPSFLVEIDRPYCPILDIELTHSSGELTDWSVDRLNNQGGYAIGNLAVMSTMANVAKGNLSFSEIEALSRQPHGRAGLTCLHWQRMASLLTGPYSVTQETEALLALCIIPPPYVPLNFFQELQLILVRETKKKPSPVLAKIQQLCDSRATLRLFKKVVKKVGEAQKTVAVPMELWLDPANLEALKAFFLRLTPETLTKIRLVCERSLGSEQLSADLTARWALEKKGFVCPQTSPELPTLF